MNPLMPQIFQRFKPVLRGLASGPSGARRLGAAAVAALGLGAAADAQEFAYDVHGRLITVTYASGDVVTYCYDRAGNRTRHVVGTAVSACPANTAPVAVDDTEFVYEGQLASIAALANDSDPENDTLTITAVSAASPFGTPTISGSLIFFTPPAAGVYTFTYTISDPDGLTDTATITVTALEECTGFHCDDE